MRERLNQQMAGDAGFEDKLEELLQLPYWVIDILPEQVPPDSPGQFFAVERYYLQSPRVEELRRKFAGILLKLNCYYDFEVFAGPGGAPLHDPGPEKLVRSVIAAGPEEDPVSIMILSENVLITIGKDDTYMTAYGLTSGMRDLIGKLAGAEGLFLWQPPQD